MNKFINKYFLLLFIWAIALYSLSFSAYSAQYYRTTPYCPDYTGVGSTPADAVYDMYVFRKPVSIGSITISPRIGTTTAFNFAVSGTMPLITSSCTQTNGVVNTVNEPSCPPSIPNEWSDGICYAQPEPQNCPDGQFLENDVCTDGCSQGASVKQVLSFEQISSSTTDPILGCKLTLDPNKKLDCNGQTFMCNVFYIDSGIYDETFSYENGEAPDPIPEITPSPEPVSTETVNGPVIETINNPDGSTTTTETTTTTQTNELGYEVETIGDSIVLKNQAGEIIEILQQYEINSYTDGSSDITETTTTTATPNSITEVKKNLTDGSTTTTTRTYQSGKSGTIVTTKTTTYDSTGQPTGSTSSTSGDISETDGSGNGEGEGEGTAFCDYADVVCDFIEWFQEPTDEPEVPDMPVEELALEDIQSEWTSGLGSGSCPANPSTNLLGTVIEYDMSVYCQVATDIIYWLLIFSATITGGFIIAGIRS